MISLNDWDLFAKYFFCENEAERLFSNILKETFGKPLSPFRELLDNAVEGYGFSIFEAYGYAMYKDNDLPADLPYIIICCDNDVYELPMDRYLFLLRVACEFYVYSNKHLKDSVLSQYKKIFSLYSKINVN